MKLEFKKEYLSIDKFDPIELPDFTVLTGVNGAGKSHFLGAIENESIAISDINALKIKIASFSYETFKLNNEPSYNLEAIKKKANSAWHFYNNTIVPIAQSQTTNKESTLTLDEYKSLKEECKDKNKSFWSIAPEQYTKNVKDFFNQLNNQHQNKEEFAGIRELAQKVQCGFHDIEKEHFMELYTPMISKNSFLPEQIGQIFWDYHIKSNENDLAEHHNQKYGKNEAVLTEDEFISRHGEKPWKAINKILNQFHSLKYKVNSPEGKKFSDSFQLKLEHLDKNNLNVDFNNLSSGEKILMALVASIYRASTSTGFPNLLLLDEIDASLHPSMIQNMLDAIQDIFLNKGIKVILVTHSPTTIALAPEESIFVMKQSGSNRIEKKSKQDALNVLTQGFVTLDQGLKLFDEITQSKLTVITEGNNAVFIDKALNFYGIKGVDVPYGFENCSGTSQLKTLFTFLSKANITNRVLFVWDCDASHKDNKIPTIATNNIYPFIFPINEENEITTKGIENLFSSSLCKEAYCKDRNIQSLDSKIKFNSEDKKIFQQLIEDRNDAEDFKNFAPLIDEIKKIQKEADEKAIEEIVE